MEKNWGFHDEEDHGFEYPGAHARARGPGAARVRGPGVARRKRGRTSCGTFGEDQGRKQGSKPYGIGGTLARDRRTATNARERRESEERHFFVF